MRRPWLGARRDQAERYLFVTIAAFALTVAGGLLTFYVVQFGAVASVVQQLVILGLLVDFADRLDARHPPRHADDTESADALVGAHVSGGL